MDVQALPQCKTRKRAERTERRPSCKLLGSTFTCTVHVHKSWIRKLTPTTIETAAEIGRREARQVQKVGVV